MEFIRCPLCKRVKFIDTDGQVAWIQLTCAEEMALSIILMSSELLLMAGGYRETEENFSTCKDLARN